jgi:hypothetical protein
MPTKAKLVIIYNKDYISKVNDFLDNFQKLPKDQTDKYQKKHHPHPETLQYDYLHKTTETPHPKETPITLPKCSNQNTQTRQPHQTCCQQHKRATL